MSFRISHINRCSGRKMSRPTLLIPEQLLKILPQYAQCDLWQTRRHPDQLAQIKKRAPRWVCASSVWVSVAWLRGNRAQLQQKDIRAVVGLHYSIFEAGFDEEGSAVKLPHAVRETELGREWLQGGWGAQHFCLTPPSIAPLMSANSKHKSAPLSSCRSNAPLLIT